MWYPRIQEDVPLIWHEGGNWARRTIYGSAATPIRDRKALDSRIVVEKRRPFVWSRNNFRIGLFFFTAASPRNRRKDSDAWTLWMRGQD